MFDSRTDAAQQLIPFLQEYQHRNSVILSIPRGGVPIGHHLAKSLHLPLDIVLTKKIGHPDSKELAVGAVSLNNRVIDRQFNIPELYIEQETRRIREDLQRRYALYRGCRKAIALEGKYLILTDDGIATGSTMYATIQLVRQENPAAISIAVPVSSLGAKEVLESEVFEFVSLITSADFRSVSQYYVEYEQVEDQEVVDLLKSKI